MTIFSPHFTVVVVLPPGDHDRFLDAARGPVSLYLPTTQIRFTSSLLRDTGFDGFPNDPNHPPSAHALLGAQRHVQQMMDGQNAGWWRARRQKAVGVAIPNETPLTASCVCQMALERIPTIQQTWFSLPRLLVWDELPRPETAYANVQEAFCVDGVTLYHAPFALEDHIRTSIFATGQTLVALPPRGVLLPDGWTVSAFPFQAPTDHALSLLAHMGRLFPCGGAAAVINATRGTQVATEMVLDGQWASATVGGCFGPEHHQDPFEVARHAWQATHRVREWGNTMHSRVREGLEKLRNPNTEIRRLF